MVFVKSPCKFAWDLYFNWLDPETVSELDLGTITDYIKIFGITGLGAVLYAFIFATNSPFDLKKVTEYMKVDEKEKKIHPNDEQFKESKFFQNVDEKKAIQEVEQRIAEENDEPDDANADSNQPIHLTDLQVIDLLIQGIDQCKSSILAYRITTKFFIHIKDYSSALGYSIHHMSLLNQEKKISSRTFKNTATECSLSLAIIYTYHEAPKNFPKALKFYDAVLRADPNNVKAKVGKGLILMEKLEYSLAENLLRGVAEEYPDDYQALKELGWCDVQLGRKSS
ncbi:unnamed protein product [Ambrosiozyma monospora]|uniref:Unnamed protein product n=1 Tax=Ambrosiozyma monospora TaxID=43982 RepID=A0ACB5TRL8_AMBMO|nr:unnamed protein product [Ambrosiozyma monospora]